MRITNLWPQTAWPTVWKDLWEAPVPGATKAAWYKVVHDILPTNERLFRIRMVPTDMCRKCDRTDTLSHRLIECGERGQIWTWTKQRLAWILRTIPERIPSDWLLRPHFTLWPPRRRHAMLWLLANLVIFRTQQQRELTLQDFIEFMKRSKWKLCQSHKRVVSVGIYLSVIDTGMLQTHYDLVIGPGGGHNMQRPTSQSHGQRLGYGNVGQPHHRWN